MNTGTNFVESFAANITDDISGLEKDVEAHPESAFARFMLLNFYYKNNNPKFESLAKQTALYFNNPHWLQFQLNQTELKKEDHSIKEQLSASFAIPITEKFEESKSVNENEEVSEEINQSELKETNEVIDEVENVETKGWEDNIEVGDAQETEEQNQSINQSELKETEEVIDEVENLETKGWEDNVEVGDAQEIEEQNQSINQSELKETNEVIDEVENVETKGWEDNIEVGVLQETENENQTPVVIHTSDLISQTDDSPVFEPLHTVDYFASQGIKIKEEALMNDKLGKQMKSFTDWLKSMKKLHPGKLPEQNEVIEKIIQASAEESNADADVLTEAMAEVLLKQNKREKAVAMYQKLSLINPSKSAYFAAKIESIKNQ